jgi:hypothetical protein
MGMWRQILLLATVGACSGGDVSRLPIHAEECGCLEKRWCAMAQPTSFVMKTRDWRCREGGWFDDRLFCTYDLVAYDPPDKEIVGVTKVEQSFRRSNKLGADGIPRVCVTKIIMDGHLVYEE